MPVSPQPRGARGTVGHPYSALNLRLALATFGLVTCGALAVVLAVLEYPIWAIVAGALAVTAMVDIVVIQRRRRARRRVDAADHSLFE